MKPISSKLKVKAKTQTCTVTSLASKALTVSPLTVTNPANNTTYKRVSGSGALSLKSDGRVTVAKGTQKGRYGSRWHRNPYGAGLVCP